MNLAGLPDLPIHDWSRLPEAISQALAELDEEDRAHRLAYIEETGEVGAFVEVDDDGTLRFTWGGRPLVKMPRTAFLRYGATPAEMS